MVKDVESQVSYEEQRTLNRMLETMLEVARDVTSILDLDRLLDVTMERVTDVMDAERSSLYLADWERNEIWTKIAQQTTEIRQPIGEGISGYVVATGETINVEDAWTCPYFNKEFDLRNNFRTRSVLCMPLKNRERDIVGSVQVLNKRGGRRFSTEDEFLLEGLASNIAIAIENARLYRENAELRKEMLRKERLAAIGETVAGLAHCIKNILNGIQGGAYMIDSGMQREKIDRVTRGWDIVKRNNTFLSDIVLDMLTYSKEREPLYMPTDINALCSSICELMAEKGRLTGVEVTCYPDETLGETQVDATAIRRVLMNLVSNGIDACEGNSGRVEMSTLQRGTDQFQIVVSDTGCGISDEHKQKLFSMFFSTKGSKGTGLGLAVTHKIIQEHNGTIAVASEVGVGTSFIISLPIHGPIGDAGS